jgi:hypothetical protein
MNKKWYIKNMGYELWIWLFMLLKYVYVRPSEHLAFDDAFGDVLHPADVKWRCRTRLTILKSNLLYL